MISTITIGGSTVRYMYPPTTRETLDESLDTGSFIIPFSTRSIPYDIFDTVAITQEEGNIDYYVVAGDQVRLTGKSPVVYEHKVSVVEYTKKLERYTINTALFTQPGGIYKGFYDSSTTLRSAYPNTIADPASRKDWYAITQGVSGIYNWDIDTNAWLYDADGRRPYMLNEVLERLIAIKNFTLVAEEVEDIRIPIGLENKIGRIKAPEFQFNNKTLRECVDEVLRFVGAVGRLTPTGTGYDTLDADYFNELKTVISTANKADYIQTQDINGYATGLTTDATNAISNNEYGASNVAYPSFDGFIALGDKQDDGIVQNDDLKMSSGLPIYKINNAFAYMEINSLDNESPQGRPTLLAKLDISDFIFEKTKWDTLEEGIASDIYRYNINKGNSIYYTIGKDEIEGLSTVPKFFWIDGDDSTWKRLLATAANRYVADFYNHDYGTIENKEVVLETAEEDVLYRLEFVTQNDVKNIKIERTLLDDINKESNFFINQSDRAINIDNFGRNSQGKLDQTGPGTRRLSLQHSTWASIYEIGDYTNDGYIITEREIIYELDFYLVSYTMTKNFNRISEFIGIDREYRAFDILALGDNAKRTLTHVDYVKLGFSIPTENTSLLDDAGINKFQDTFRSTKSVAEKMQNVRLRIGDAWGAINPAIVSPLNSFSFGNTLVFAWEFDNPQFAGFKRRTNNTTEAVRYADEEARLNEFSIRFIGDLDYGLTYTSAKAVGFALPEYQGSYTSFATSGTFNARKDPSEIIGMNYILQLYKNFADKDKIIVGNSLTNINDLIGNSNEQLYFWTSTETYQGNETQKVKGTNEGLLGTKMGTTSYYAGLPSKQIGFDLAIIGTPTVGTEAWAIADADGNLLLAVNSLSGTLEETIYFSFSKDREDLENLI